MNWNWMQRINITVSLSDRFVKSYVCSSNWKLDSSNLKLQQKWHCPIWQTQHLAVCADPWCLPLNLQYHPTWPTPIYAYKKNTLTVSLHISTKGNYTRKSTLTMKRHNNCYKYLNLNHAGSQKKRVTIEKMKQHFCNHKATPSRASSHVDQDHQNREKDNLPCQ